MEKFDTDYIGAWHEEQNRHELIALRNKLRVGHIPAVVWFQPGDGTRYEFLLVPEPKKYCVGAARDPIVSALSPDTLLVSVMGGLGQGVMSIARGNYIDGVRYRIADKLDIPNPCTAEALAATVFALWSDHFDY